VIDYDQALSDRKYLWSIGEAEDMTGGYIESEDMEKLLARPTKAQARDCLCTQIDYWFQVGPDRHQAPNGIPWDDDMVLEIARRHCVDELHDTEEQSHG
jgi:hypothetical protein